MRQGKSATRPGEPRCARLVVLATLIAAVLFAAALPARAQDRPVASLFPEPAAVAADYSDDAERFAAITGLKEKLREQTPGGGHPGAYEKTSSYTSDLQTISGRYSAPGADAVARRAFDDRALALVRDAAFRRAVLDRYRLAGLPAPETPAPATAPAVQNAGDVTDDMIKDAALRAAPFAIAGLAVMVLLARVLVGSSVASPSRRTERPAQGADAAALPEELRVVRLPGVEYTVESATGVVLEKETTTRTSVRTTTTGGEVYNVGRDVHSTPLQTQTSVTTERDELLWVRTPDGRETTWSFPGAMFQARAGHAVSVIARQRADGTPEHLLAYNHATGQLAALAGIGSAHAPRLLPALLATALAGSLLFGGACRVLLQIGPEPPGGVIGWLSVWVEGGCAAAFVAPVVVLLTIRGVVRRRNAAFDQRYLPGFRSYFAGLTTG